MIESKLSLGRSAVGWIGAVLVGSLLLGGCAAGGLPTTVGLAPDPLPAWNDGTAKRAILDYVARVTRPGGADFIPPERRVATFDFDGTVGCEKPDYMEVMVAVKRLCELTQDDPGLLDDSLYRAACDGDLATVDAAVETALLQAFLDAPQATYVDYVEDFLTNERHPRFDMPYGQLYYAPMFEVIAWLRANDFEVYVVSGSQQGFTRSYGESVLGLASEHLIGHAVELEFAVGDDGAAVLKRQDAFRSPSVGGKGKAEIIRQRIGRPPVLAFGNSMGDFEMLRYATSGDDPGLALILVHDDPDEYVYQDQKLIDHAEELGWQRISMKDDFRVLFPE